MPAELGVCAPVPPPSSAGMMFLKPGIVSAQRLSPVVPRFTWELSLTSMPRPLLELRRLSATSAPAPRVTATPLPVFPMIVLPTMRPYELRCTLTPLPRAA